MILKLDIFKIIYNFNATQKNYKYFYENNLANVC